MIPAFGLVLLSSLLHTAGSTTLYPQQTAQRPPTLLLDFQKNNVSSSWAPGHPIEWNNKTALKFTFNDGGPVGWVSGSIWGAELSPDEKYLVTSNVKNHVSVVDFTTGTTVFNTTLASTYTRGESALRVLANPAGGYDVLVSLGYQELHRLRLSPDGTQIGNATIYSGGLLWKQTSPSISHSGRRFLVANPNVPYYNLYDLDDANVQLNLSNQIKTTDFDCAFTPDDQHVVATSRTWGNEGSTKLFSTTTGALVRDFGDTSSEVISISPDGKVLVTTYSWDTIQIWSLFNETADHINLDIPLPLNGGFTSLKWSPDGAYLVAGNYGNIFIWKMAPSPQLVQHWQMDVDYYDVLQILWLGTTKQLVYRAYGGLEIYDTESNLKYRWGFGPNSHWTIGPSQPTKTILAKGKGWIGGLDSDGIVRFWAYPL